METLSAAATVCSVCGERLNIKAQCLACLLRGGLDDPAEHCLPPPASLVFGNFEIARREDGSFWELGCGAMGVTYRAVDKVLHRTVALKVIETPAATGDSQVVRERFLREARAAAALKHPNVAGIFQFGASPEIDRCYYAMELVEGETLEALVRREGPLKVELALEIAIQVTRALIGAAAQGLIHRDLKPGNIMITRPDAATAAIEVKVIDFGLAKATNAVAETDLTHGGFIGTPSFASPEQFGSGPADARSDIYSLGVTLWYALTGQVPYPGKTIEEIRDRQKHTDLPIEQLNERKIPASLIDMLRRTLALDPTQRPASARELMEALESCRAKLAHRGGIRFFRKLAALLAVVAIAAAIALAFLLLRMVGTDRRAGRTGEQDSGRRSAASLPEKSIAVLPLENLSEERDNAFFAEGIQDELLSNLSKIKELKVISRTSVMQYKSGITRNLKEIAQQLGVGNIVEGSVRRAGNRVRVSVQLIDAQTDRHIWVQNYDRTLADSLALQGELATEIAAGVGATLSPQEKARVEAKPTNNPAAYEAYLRGRAFAGGSPFDKSNVERTIQSYQEAVKLDPNFVLAWAYLSCAQSQNYWIGIDPTPAQLAAAKDALDRALALDPNLPETHLAFGYYRYFGQRDFAGGLAEFQQAEKGLPNDVDIIYAIALIQRRLGHWDEAIAGMRRAIELDPRDINAYFSLGVTYRGLRRFPEDLAMFDRILALEPTNADALYDKALALWATGDLQAVEPLLANPATDPYVRGTQALFQRRYAAAIEMLSSAVAAKIKRGEPSDDEQFLLGLSQQRTGDVAAAHSTYEKAAKDIRRELEKVPPGSFHEADLRAALGLAHAGLGEAASAIAEGQEAMAMRPTSKDPWEGPGEEARMASIYALLGDADHAITILKRLLQIPSAFALTPALLRLDPVWDPIRNDPRFQELAALTPLSEKSIAVLPLENLSEERDNAFFAEGIQDELLSNLSKIKELKVISRTSVMQYKSGSTRNLKEIAQQLGVGNIVEGSVRRAGNRVRVSVQLIDAQTDRHLWVQNYDRTLADSLALQGELATEIAAGVGATLSPQEKARVEAKPTNNPTAYDAYLRGRAFAGGSPWDKSTVENTIQSYQEAVKLDPSFALAWAYLSCAQSQSYWQGHDPSPARLAAAKDALDRALALDPDLPETHLALGYYRYYGQRDFTEALTEFQQAEQGLPNNVDITDAIALVQRRLGHWEEAIDEFRRVVELDPRNTNAYNSLAVTYGSLRRFPEALATVDRVLAWEPANELALGLKAFVFWATGDLQAVEPLLAKPGTEPRVPGGATVPVRGVQALFQRRYAAAREIVSSAVAANTKRGEPSYDGKLDLGLIQQRAGDVAAARATYEKAAQDIRREFEKVAPGSHTEVFLHSFLGLAYAGLGEAASAIAEGQKAMAMRPTSKDPFEGPGLEEGMARIYALIGDADHAIPILKRLLQIPYGGAITPALLRLDPVWDPIRNDPRFQEVVTEKKP